MSGEPLPAHLGEFELIARYLAPLSAGIPGAFGLQDDAATVALPPGQDLVVTTDAMIEGVHFLLADGPARIAQKLLRVNLSDLAAKGAAPLGYQMILGFPQAPEAAWIAAFANGLAADQRTFGIVLTGGDTVRSPGGLTLGITAFGTVPQGTMLRRAGSQPGDDIWVSGTIGDAALALMAKLEGRRFSDEAQQYFDERLELPVPRLALGQALRGFAHAAMDVSDGLAQDAGHLARAGSVAFVIDAAAVPLSEPAKAAVASEPALLPRLLTGGDDYELLFTARPSHREAIAGLASAQDVALTRIGRVAVGQGVEIRGEDGRPLSLAHAGYQHF